MVGGRQSAFALSLLMLLMACTGEGDRPETFDGLGRCEDFDEIPELGGSVAISSGSTVAVVGDAQRVSGSVGVVRVGDGRRQLADVADLDLSAGSAILRVSPGQRVIEVFARWEQGDAELYFPIEVT